jgi:hypothetical protein
MTKPPTAKQAARRVVGSKIRHRVPLRWPTSERVVEDIADAMASHARAHIKAALKRARDMVCVSCELRRVAYQCVKGEQLWWEHPRNDDPTRTKQCAASPIRRQILELERADL